MAALARMKTGAGYLLSFDQTGRGAPVVLTGWDGTTSQELVSMSEADFVIFTQVAQLAQFELLSQASMMNGTTTLEGLR